MAIASAVVLGEFFGSASFRGTTRKDNKALHNSVDSQFMYQANNRVSEVWEHHGGYDPNATTWPGSNISALIYAYAPDGQETWGARQPDGGASGSALEDGEGENYAYNSDSSIAGFGYRSANTQQTPNSQGDSNAEAPVAGPGSYGNNYTYDASGNRTQANQMGANISYGADGENRYDGSLYDGNSNTTDSAVGWTYAYDAQGQMTSATRQSDGFGIGFAYDGLGRLVYQGSPAGTTIFCYAGKRRIEERSTNGNTSLYRYFFDSPKSDEIVFRQTSNGQEYGGTRLYYQYDAQGNTTHVSNDAGQVVEQYLYDAYGKPYVYNAAGTYLGQVGTQDNRYLFHGASAYEWLSTPGLYYCRHRMYLPVHGRWLQPDPSGFAGGDINLYRYCENDPVNSSDPSGLDAEPDLTPDYAETGGGPGDDDDNLQIYQDTPTGSHIPSTSYTVGGYTMESNAVLGATTTSSPPGGVNFEGYTADGVPVAQATSVSAYPSYPINQDYPTNPIAVGAIDLGCFVEGVIGNAIGVTTGAILSLAGVLDFNADAIQEGSQLFLEGLLPRYGLYAGPGWGIPETYLGLAPMLSPIDVAAYNHDVNYFDSHSLSSADAVYASQLNANAQLVSGAASGSVGVFGTIYSQGIALIYAGGH